MASAAVHLLVFDGFADWEPAYALAELRRWGKRAVVAVGFTTNTVMSMGGLRVMPDRSLSDVRAEDVELLILPGGDLWEGEYPRAVLQNLLAALISAHTPIAAICGATLAVARAGLLNDRRHTSNTSSYLRNHVPDYTGDAKYEETLAVYDQGVITASGLGPVEFARLIFRQLGLFSQSDEQLWFDMFKHGQLPSDAV